MRRSNHLILEKSPYLMQHAHNPVDWYPWGQEAFSRARTEQMPILLSIGYSTCHWCHVMAHESFENESIAALMNEYFVCIKVDREERPDVDKVYMTALQAMGQNGGWPMTMFLTPDLKPFYGGTYFPPASRYERAGLPDVLRKIHEIWLNEREKVEESAEGITRFLLDVPQLHGTADQPGRQALVTCFNQLRKTFDDAHGGFGDGAKFPRPVVFDFLMVYHTLSGEPEALRMTEQSLRAMAAGGMYDHIGGGFHRYTVDAAWRVPHFEKMLYDQAQLANAYLDLFRATRDPVFETVVRETLDYVLRDLLHPEGAFYSAEDADSPNPDKPGESGEGAFYLWTKGEIESVLGDDASLFCYRYGVEQEGNAPFDPQQEFAGKNILYAAHSLSDTAGHIGRAEAEARTRLDDSRKKLFERRSHRPRPHRDDKVLTSWNGLMIGALARASQTLHEPGYLEAAKRAADFLCRHAFNQSTGRLTRRFRDGEAKFEANLDDYAFLASGLISLFESSGDPVYLERSLELTRTMMRLFGDSAHGGFYDTVDSDPSLLVRMKEQYDGAEPTGNAVAAMNLLRLSHITGHHDWLEAADCTINAFTVSLQKQPIVMPAMASVLALSLAGARQMVVVGPADEPETRKLLNEIFTRYLPESVIVRSDGTARPDLVRHLPFAGSLPMANGKPTVYICRDYRCDLPVTSAADLGHLLDADNRNLWKS